MIRQGSNLTHRCKGVSGDEVIIVQGSNAEIIVEGNVWSGAKVVAQGSNATIRISGHVYDAEVTAQGSSASVEYFGASPRARITAQGSNSEVVDKSVPAPYDFEADAPKPPPDRSKLEFGTRFPSNLFTSSSSSIGSLNVTGVKSGKIIIDGVDVTELLTNKPKVKPQDVPPTDPSGTLSVQKSQRPRELWGT